ncbi:gamma-parvin isoform X3 [Hyperolius riggenbachi]|uniref:gamma-parvin isoform X3 n=1 Tax=Hyperolius riggenbachi TaxID=752182 RepID=UPI0035A3A1B4
MKGPIRSSKGRDFLLTPQNILLTAQMDSTPQSEEDSQMIFNVEILGEGKRVLQPTAESDPKLQELKTFLVDWINFELKHEHIVVKSLDEDLFDGLILHHLLPIHSKDLLATLHLLIALAQHFRPDLPLPPNVSVEVVVMEPTKSGMKTGKAIECLTGSREEEATPKKDVFDQLFQLSPDKINDVKQAILNFVNKQLVNLSLTVTDLESQFADGVILLLLIGQVEGYFIPLSTFFLCPQSMEDRLHNVTLALDLLMEAGMLQQPMDPSEIVNQDLKITLRVLYTLFLKHKNSPKPS